MDEKWNEKWNEKTISEKVATIISIVAFCVWILFEFLERKSALKYADTVNCISICVICVCEAVSFWKVRRSLAYVAIGGAIIMITVLILHAMLIS